MSYYIQNSQVPININMSTLEGIGITGLTQSNVNLKLIRSGITVLNGITGDYTFAEQHNGIYRIILGTTLTTLADTDYVLIATDLTTQALDDKLEFTLYAESVDSSYTKLKSEIDANEAILNTINANTDTIESLLTNATYGLSEIKTKEDSISTQLSTTRTDILNEVISQVNANEVKIDILTSNLSDAETSILNEINTIPTNPLLTNDSRLNNLTNLDVPVSNGSTATQLSTTRTDILNEVISRDRLTEINTIISNLSNVENNIINEVNAIPTNPLTDTNPILVNIDTPISTRSSLTDQQVWSYTSRQLTGVSGVNQINVNDFMSQFIVNEDLYLTIDMVDTNTNPVTGLSYTGPASGSLDIILYKNGIKQIVSTATVAVSGLEEGLYRVFLAKTLMDTPKVDYVLIAKDRTTTAITYKKQFSLFEVVGLEGAYQATIIVKDVNTNLPVPDTQIYVKDNTQVSLINKGISGIDGKYLVGLGVGDYKIILKKAFTDFTVPETMTVSSSGSNTFTFWGSGFSASNPTSSATCILYGWVTDLSGNFVKGAKVTATEPNNTRFMGTNKIVKTTKSTTTDNSGYFELELIYSSLLTPIGLKYSIDITYTGFSYSKQVLIPNVSTVEFSTL